MTYLDSVSQMINETTQPANWKHQQENRTQHLELQIRKRDRRIKALEAELDAKSKSSITTEDLSALQQALGVISTIEGKSTAKVQRVRSQSPNSTPKKMRFCEAPNLSKIVVEKRNRNDVRPMNQCIVSARCLSCNTKPLRTWWNINTHEQSVVHRNKEVPSRWECHEYEKAVTINCHKEFSFEHLKNHLQL